MSQPGEIPQATTRPLPDPEDPFRKLVDYVVEDADFIERVGSIERPYYITDVNPLDRRDEAAAKQELLRDFENAIQGKYDGPLLDVSHRNKIGEFWPRRGGGNLADRHDAQRALQEVAESFGFYPAEFWEGVLAESNAWVYYHRVIYKSGAYPEIALEKSIGATSRDSNGQVLEVSWRIGRPSPFTTVADSLASQRQA